MIESNHATRTAFVAREIGNMTSNASAMELPRSGRDSGSTAHPEGTGPARMAARYTDRAQQLRGKTWYPAQVGIPAAAAVAAVMATWRNR